MGRRARVCVGLPWSLKEEATASIDTEQHQHQHQHSASTSASASASASTSNNNNNNNNNKRATERQRQQPEHSSRRRAMSDEVSQFLEQVERLRGQQVDDDEVRARELEEFLAAKRERQARREERARSISPQKSSPANTPSPRSSRPSVYLSEALRLESPSAFRDGLPRDQSEPPADATPMALSGSPTKENEAAADASETTRAGASTPPARSSTLSWQQRRPNSRGGSRPLSMVAAQNATQRSLVGTQEPVSATEQSFSKEQIAQALGSKDPSWFRQTADRGLGSAAYRRDQVEDEDRLDMASVKAQLPGMSAKTPKERPSSSDANTPLTPGILGSPFSLNPPRYDGPADDKPLTEQTITFPTGRTSPIRASSPTKGMGGFVQSAMMKRSDSVKRWSVTSPPGLTRADSVASNRNTHDRGSSQAGSRPPSTIRGPSTTPGSSRPTSRHGEKETVQETAPKSSTKDLALETERALKRDDDAALPSSPSKTTDPRRWSPTKSSWLESALNRPDSPKLPPKPTQSHPAWVSELNKGKPGRTAEAGRPASLVSHKHQVSIGGLMRQSPMGEVAKPNTTGLGGIYSPPPHANRPAFGHAAKPSDAEKMSKPELDEESKEKLADDQDTPALEKQRSVTSPAPAKPKPETPPKKDFRANLKQRPSGQDGPKTQEPEFKNVFGNLRRTKTQNYVAPDELKDNILRGKAALNLTEGPKKNDRKDEFKEAILKKREDFKKAQAEGKGITRSPTTAADKPVPEGLAKRAELGRSMIGARKDSVTETKPTEQPKKADTPKPTPGPKRIPSQPAFSPRSPNTAAPPAKSPTLEKPRRVSTDTKVAKHTTAEPRGLPSLQKETSAPSRLQQGRVGGGGGKLADRFSPALAGMLARGPPPMATNGGQSPDDSGSQRNPSAGDTTDPTAPGPQLTHMTKNRVRGPRRKAPAGSSAASAPSSTKPAESAAPAPAPAEPAKPKEPERKLPGSSLKPEARDELISTNEKPAPLSIQQQVAAKSVLRGKPAGARPEAIPSASTKEPAATTSSFLRKQAISVDPRADTQLSASRPPEKAAEEATQPSSPRKLDMRRMSKFLDEAHAIDAEPEPPKEPARLRHQRTGSRSPVKLSERPLPQPLPSPTKSDRDSLPSMRDSAPRSPRVEASVKSPSPAPKPSFDAPVGEATTPRPKSRGAVRPLPGLSGGGLKSPPAMASPVRSPTKKASEVSTLLTDIFGPARPRTAVKVDPAEILMSHPSTGAKITSLGFQMFQIFGDGKKIPVSAQNERVLFEQEMYVCAHNFANAAGKKVFEVYFWVGDEVPEATAEDAQLFVQREAKSLGGKLVKLRQGKETVEFLQALGGVIIVRRGSSNKYDSLAPNMLCGRRYLGQVAFDEVDFAPSSLCTGFTYLLTQSGRCFLWKGKGSDVTEVSCARLIGMDLTLTGELVEYEDGSEPGSFWKMFGDGISRPHSADHWRLKPNYGKYCSRLFCSDADSRQQIFEISPFGQADLSQFSIYVLDAFFEMYIVVGARANSQYASFRNALDFAQEYAILAAGIEDRPFVPVSTVVLEGIPRDLKRVFRKWDEARSPTVTNPQQQQQQGVAGAQGLKRARSLRVLTLTQALQALTE
ncbi:Villidin [Tolypocladium ophioglossoides CBS 100239]|uniref:Villidin n=1 Tax=Tolypocladium ophioglossoides (strain CBS 100239) TaxID=1163406 RepID=A0A0L0N2F7_TOLOC|nr:Villidin [Tolypocladium ophioglossoides CBS 100239]